MSRKDRRSKRKVGRSPVRAIVLLGLCLAAMFLLMYFTGCTLRPVWTLNGLQHEVVCP